MQRVLIILAGALSMLAVHAAPFINLDFEGIDANNIGGYPFPPGGQASIQAAMPGWAINGVTNGAMNFNYGCGDFYCNSFITREAFDRHFGFTNIAYQFFPNGLHGNFGIGLEKKWGIRHGVAPVIYTHSKAKTRPPVARGSGRRGDSTRRPRRRKRSPLPSRPTKIATG